MIQITEKAAKKFLEIRRKAGRMDAALRVAVLGGDCGGLNYHIGLDDFRVSGDYCFVSRGIDIYIDHQSVAYLNGAEIDWMDVDDDAGFVIYNPNKGRSRGGCSNDGSGQGCMTQGDGVHCVKDKSGCDCNADSTEIVYINPPSPSP